VTIEVHTLEQPAWIKALVDDVVLECIRPDGFMGPLAFAWWEPGNPDNTFSGWQIMVYPTPNELRGAHAEDGCRFVNGFRLDVGRIMQAMGPIEDVVWNTPTRYTGFLDGPELSVQGAFAGRHVLLRVFNLPPPGTRATYYVNPRDGSAVKKPSD
jgi:hypothetical protein